MPFEKPNDMGEFRTLVMGLGEKKCFVQVSTEWCGPCQGIKVQMEQLSTDLADSYVFVYIDCDKCEQMQELFQIATMPTFLIFKGPGMPSARYEGALPDKIREFANEHKDA